MSSYKLIDKLNREYTNQTTQDLCEKIQLLIKTRPLSKDNKRKNNHYLKNYYNHILINNFLSPKPKVHDPKKYSLTKQTRNTHVEEPNAPIIYLHAWEYIYIFFFHFESPNTSLAFTDWMLSIFGIKCSSFSLPFIGKTFLQSRQVAEMFETFQPLFKVFKGTEIGGCLSWLLPLLGNWDSS